MTIPRSQAGRSLPHDLRTDSAARDRIAEIGEILALGLIRLRARKSSQLSADRGERSLDCVGDQSGHADNILRTEPRS
jgi:hypothetical protein